VIRYLLALWFAAGLSAQTTTLLDQADEAFRQGDLERAGALARRAIQEAPAAVQGYMILGVIAAQKGEWSASDSHFETVVKLDPASPYGYFYLGQAKLYQKQWDAAIRLFTSAIERQYPETGRLLVELAVAQNESGHPYEALTTLSKTPPPDDPRLAAQYFAVTAFAHGNLNRLDKALEAIRHALQFDESAPDYWAFLIDILIRTDQMPQALAEAIRAQRKFPDQQEIQFLFALANYHVAESPLSRLALRNLQEADPADARVLLAKGLVERKEGNNAAAIEAFRRAAAPASPTLTCCLGFCSAKRAMTPEPKRSTAKPSESTRTTARCSWRWQRC